MTPDVYLMEFARAVRDMQTKQKAYFQTRQKELLFDAIEAEKISQLLFSGMMPDSSSGDPSKSIDGGTLFINHIDRLPSAIQYRIALLIMGKQKITIILPKTRQSRY